MLYVDVSTIENERTDGHIYFEQELPCATTSHSAAGRHISTRPYEDNFHSCKTIHGQRNFDLSRISHGIRRGRLCSHGSKILSSPIWNKKSHRLLESCDQSSSGDYQLIYRYEIQNNNGDNEKQRRGYRSNQYDNRIYV